MKLGKYKGLHIAAPDVTVSEADIMKVLKNKQQQFSVVANIDDRAAAKDDEVLMNYYVSVDGTEVAGTQVENYPIVLGSHKFIPGFEEGLMGHMAGDLVEIPVTFPAQYRVAALQGKAAVFHVTVKQIRIRDLQPIDDDFALDFSEYDTLEEWKSAIREELTERRAESTHERLAKELVNMIIETSDIPMDEEFVEEVADELYDDFVDELEMDGISLEKYLSRRGMTEEALYDSKIEEAQLMIAQQYVLHGIAQQEHLSVTPEEIADELAQMAAEEGEDVEEFADMLGDEEIESISDELLMNKAVAFIMEHAIFE